MLPFLRHPITAWLAPLAVLLAMLVAGWSFAALDEDFGPVFEPDTESYLTAPLDAGPAQILSYYRTVGYPWLLRWGRRLGPGLTPIPWLQALLYSAGVLAFFIGLRRYVARPWLALLATLPLPFAAVTAYTRSLLTEVPAAALALATAGLCLALAGRAVDDTKPSRRRAVWVRALPYAAIGATVFCANQVRPTTQWLVLWAPLAVLILARARGGRGWLPAGLTAVSVFAPWLTFALARLMIVGHFGLVSFAGTNLAAVGTFLADENAVAQMADDVRPTARLIVKRRRNNGWPRLEFGDDARLWFRRYNHSLWKVAFRSANWHLHREQRSVPDNSDDGLWGRPFPVERDRRLQAFAIGAIRHNPGGYIAWIAGAARHGLRGMASMPLVIVGLTTIAIAALRRSVTPDPASSLARPHLAAAAACGLHAAGALTLVSLISFPNERYLSEVVLLVPSGLVLLATALWPASSRRARARSSGNV